MLTACADVECNLFPGPHWMPEEKHSDPHSKLYLRCRASSFGGRAGEVPQLMGRPLEGAMAPIKATLFW